MFSQVQTGTEMRAVSRQHKRTRTQRRYAENLINFLQHILIGAIALIFAAKRYQCDCIALFDCDVICCHSLLPVSKIYVSVDIEAYKEVEPVIKITPPLQGRTGVDTISETSSRCCPDPNNTARHSSGTEC